MMSVGSSAAAAEGCDDGFVRAVMVVMSPDAHGPHDELYSQAFAYCQSIQHSPDGWRLCLSRLPQLAAADAPQQVSFFCLQTLASFVSSPSYLSLPAAGRSSFASSLLVLLRDVYPAHPPSSFLLNKLSSVLTAMFKRDYPELWPTFFSDLLSLLPVSPVAVDVFLRVLLCIDQEVVLHDWRRAEAEVQRNVRIKDHVRQGQDMRRVVDAVTSVLRGLRDAREHERLVLSALDVLKEFTGWIDISLVANDAGMTLLYSLITAPQYAAFRAAALRCVTEVCEKKMDRDSKLELLQQYRVLDMLSSLPLRRLDTEAAKETATLISCIGQQLITASSPPAAAAAAAGGASGSTGSSSTSPERVAAMVETAMALSYTVLESCPSAVINDSDVLAVLKLYIRSMTASPAFLPAHSLHARRIFHALTEAMLYPPSFNFDRPSDAEEAFLDFRSALHVTLCNLVPCMPDLCVDLTGQLIASVISRWREEEWRRVEAALRLLYDMGEALKGGVQSRVLSEPMSGMLSLVLRSDVCSHPHHAVVLVWQLVVHRYTRFLEAHADCVPAVLTAFLDQRGLHHPHPAVRGKACYLLYKLLLAFPDGLRKTLRPFVDSMLRQVQAVLETQLTAGGGGGHSRQLALGTEDSNYLCEVMGILVSSSVTGEACAEYVSHVLSFFAAHLSAALAAASSLASSGSVSPAASASTSSSQSSSSSSASSLQSSSPELEKAGERIAVLLDSFGNVSKPLSRDTARVSPLFDLCFSLICQLFALLPRHEAVRAKTVFVVHRMVECQGARVLTALPQLLPALLSCANHSNLPQVLPLINQMIISFKTAFLPLLDAHFLSVCSKAVSCLEHYQYVDAEAEPASSSAYSSDRQERLLLQQRYFSFLKLVLTELPQVVTSSSNVAGLPQVVDSIMAGWRAADSGVQRTCIQCVSALVKQLQTAQMLSDSRYHHYVHHDITAATYRLLFSPSLSLADANAFSTFRELVSLQYLLLSSLGSSYLPALGDWLINQQGMTAEAAQDWIALLPSGDTKRLSDIANKVKGQAAAAAAAAAGGGAGAAAGKERGMNGHGLQPPLLPDSNGSNGAIHSRSSSSTSSYHSAASR